MNIIWIYNLSEGYQLYTFIIFSLLLINISKIYIIFKFYYIIKILIILNKIIIILYNRIGLEFQNFEKNIFLRNYI